MFKYKKKLLLVIGALLMTSCTSTENSGQSHLEKGKELFEKGELDKALLELKTSIQEDKQAQAYYYMALLDEKRNNFKSMEQNLLRTLELDPGFIDAKIKLGKVELLFGNLEKAQAQAEEVLRAQPDNTDAKLVKVSVLYRQTKQYEADNILAAILTAEPDNVDALSLKIGRLMQENKADQAMGLLNVALQKDPKNIPLHLTRIKLNSEQKNSEAIIGDYQELIKNYPENENFKFSLAAVYAFTDKLVEAEALLRELVEKAPDKVENKVMLFEFLNAKTKDRVPNEFEKWLASGNQPAKQVLEMSTWMLTNGYEELAEKGLKQVVDSEKDSVIGLTARTELAEVAFAKKQYELVGSEVESILKINSDFLDASFLKARLLMSQNKVDDAIELLNKAVWAKKDADKAYFLLGQAYLQKKDRKQADKNFKEALNINPANIGAFIPVFEAYMQANQKETARQYLDKALKVKPNQSSLLTSKVELDIEEKKWESAQETLQKLALFSKNKVMPLYLQANILQGKGQYAEAIAIYQKLLDDYPDNLNSMVNLARSYEGLKSRDKAIAYLEAQHVKHPDNLSVVAVLGDLYLADKDMVKARQIYTDQLKRMPNAVSVYLELAKVEAAYRKSADGAKDIYLKGLESNKDDPRLMIALASLYEQTGEKASARKIYEHLLEIQQENDLARNNLANILVDSGNQDDLKKGLTLAEKYKDVENPYFQDTYAWALIKNGATAEGLKLLESLVVKEPKAPELRYHLGVAYFNNGNKATAITELKQALSLAEKQRKDFSGKNDAKKLLQEIESTSKK